MNTMIKYLFTLLILLQAGALWAQQPAKVAKKFFADPEMDIHTPWFQKGNACTTYDEMMSYINNLITHHPETASLSFIGKTQKGVEIPAVRIAGMSNYEFYFSAGYTVTNREAPKACSTQWIAC